MTITSRDQLSGLLEQVAKSLDIPDEKHDEAVRRYEEVGHWLEDQDGEARRRPPKVYSQGSFRLGTVVRPVSDAEEYDIDLVYERDIRKKSTSQEILKAEAGEHLDSFVCYLHESHRAAPKLLDEGRRCWTLQYTDGFHLDLLPAIPDDACRARIGKRNKTAIEITDREFRGWKSSNPIGYSEWFNDRMREQFLKKRAAFARSQLEANGLPTDEMMVKAAAEQVPDHKIKTPLQRAIQVLKRHRDIHFKDDPDNRPASIILTTLAAKAYDNEENLVDALLRMLRGMPNHIEDRLVDGRRVAWVQNPVNENENFADRWEDAEHPQREKQFREWLDKADRDVTNALMGGGIHKVIQLLGQSLGPAVLTKAASAIGVDFYQRSQSGVLNMEQGTGGLISKGRSPQPATQLPKHNFYGDS